jgi:hypothetical protein
MMRVTPKSAFHKLHRTSYCHFFNPCLQTFDLINLPLPRAKTH